MELFLQAQAGGGIPNGVIMIVVMVVLFWLIILLPQKKEQKKRQAMLDAVKKGDKIVSLGGLCGKVQTVKAATVVVKMVEGTVELERASIARIENNNSDKSKDERGSKK